MKMTYGELLPGDLLLWPGNGIGELIVSVAQHPGEPEARLIHVVVFWNDERGILLEDISPWATSRTSATFIIRSNGEYIDLR